MDETGRRCGTGSRAGAEPAGHRTDGRQQNWLGAELGDLSQYYETGNNADPGFYSTVDGDQGGTSYGIYMFASNAGTPLSFVQWLQEFSSGSIYRYMGDKLYNAYAYNLSGKYAPGYGSNFNATWRSIGDDYPEEFTQAQKDYWETHAYTDLLNNLKAAVPAFDLNDYSIALRNVLWSRSVHHGAGVIRGANSSDGRSGATGVVLRAFDKLGGFRNQSEAQLIQAIYDECSRLSATPEADKRKRMSGETAESTASAASPWPISAATPATCSSASTAACTSTSRRTRW